jgi:hypothetical protein
MTEIGILLLALMMVLGLVIILRSIKQFLLNALVGLLVLFVANILLDPGIGYSWMTVLICGLGGALGAIIVIILHLMGVAF